MTHDEELAAYTKEIGHTLVVPLTLTLLIESHRRLREQLVQKNETHAKIYEHVRSELLKQYKDAISIDSLREMTLQEIIDVLTK